MILSYLKFIGIILLAALAVFCSSNEDLKKIPYPQALKESNIKVKDLNNILNGSLIIGNGDINALVFAEDNSVILNLTKNDVWDARLETDNDPPIPTLELIQKLGNSGNAFPLKSNDNGYVLPDGIKWDKIDSYHSNPYPCPRQCARVVIDNNNGIRIIDGEVDLEDAVVNIRQSNNDNIEIRALADENVFIIKTAGTVKLNPIKSDGLPDSESGTVNNVSWIKQEIPPDLDWEGMHFAVASAVKGELNAVSIVTSLESDDVLGDAVKIVREIIEADVSNLINNHNTIWEDYWSESGIKIDNKILESTWYRSLYFLRCVSKPGVQSVGLFAGLINDTPAWHGDYHTNYNIQQTYWTAYQSNHPELAEPYDRLIYEYLSRAKWLAKKVYSMNGAYYPHVMYAYEPSDPDLVKSRNGRQYIHHTWGMTIGVNGFSVQPLWWRYKYDPNPERLKKIVYPVLREVATFYSDFIENCGDSGIVRLGPSVSPEHWGWTKNLVRNYNCTFDIAYARYILTAAIEAASILNEDNKIILRFQNSLKRLPDYPTTGGLSPIVVDVEGAPEIVYNIPVPSTPVFPGEVVSWWSSNKEKEIFKRTIENMKWNGNNATFMLAISRSRLSMPETISWLENEIQVRSRPNGTISLNKLDPPRRFNDFGHYTEQFGAGLAVVENLLQSVGDIIRIFPSVEKETNASFENLRAQGGYLVSADMKNESITKLKIKSLYGGVLKLLSPWPRIKGSNNRVEEFTELVQDSLGVISVNTLVGDTWEFRKY